MLETTTEPRAGDGAGRVRSRKLTVVIADSDEMARARTCEALEHSAFEVVAEAGHASEAVDAALRLHPRLCLLAVDLPGDALEATREIFLTVPRTKIAVLTGSVAEDEAVHAIRSGAEGYLLKSVRPARLRAALRAMAHNETAFPRALTARFVQELRVSPSHPGDGHGRVNRTVMYVPRFIRHLRRRRHMSFGLAWHSTRMRMREYR